MARVEIVIKIVDIGEGALTGAFGCGLTQVESRLRDYMVEHEDGLRNLIEGSLNVLVEAGGRVLVGNAHITTAVL